MNTYKKYIMFLFLGLWLCSCSSDDNSNNTSNSELLVEQSPWTFSTYELISTSDLGDSTVTEQDLIEEVINESTGGQLSFYADGTGFSDSPGDNNDSTFTWLLLEDDQIQIEIEGEVVFENVMVTSEELRITLEDIEYVDAGFDITFFGTYVFN